LRDLIFVAGLPRSGTSVVSRLLALCGAGLPAKSMRETPTDREGYGDPGASISINARFLRRKDSSWYDPFLVQARSRDEQAFVADAAAFLKACFGDEPVLVLADPRICCIFELWIEAAKRAGFRPRVVHVFRHPGAVAASLLAHDGIATTHSQALWVKYGLEIERHSRQLPRALIGYEDLIAEPEPGLQRCIRDLGVELRGSDDAKRMVQEFIDPGLNDHGVPPGDTPKDQTPGRWISRLYEALRAGAEQGVVDSGEFDDIYESLARSQRFYQVLTSEARTRQSVEAGDGLATDVNGVRKLPSQARTDDEARPGDRDRTNIVDEDLGELREQTEALKVSHAAERGRLLAMARTLQKVLAEKNAHIAEKEANRARLEHGSEVLKAGMAELRLRWAEAEHRLKDSRTDAQSAHYEAQQWRGRLLAVELRRNRLFGEFVVERHALSARLRDLQAPEAGPEPRRDALASDEPTLFELDDATAPGSDDPSIAEHDEVLPDTDRSGQPDGADSAFSPEDRPRSRLLRLAGRGRRVAAGVSRRLRSLSERLPDTDRSAHPDGADPAFSPEGRARSRLVRLAGRGRRVAAGVSRRLRSLSGRLLRGLPKRVARIRTGLGSPTAENGNAAAPDE